MQNNSFYPPLEGTGFLSRDSRIIYTPVPSEAWGDEKKKNENVKGQREWESGSSEAWKVEQACVMFLERKSEMAKEGGCWFILGSAQVRLQKTVKG